MYFSAKKSLLMFSSEGSFSSSFYSSSGVNFIAPDHILSPFSASFQLFSNYPFKHYHREMNHDLKWTVNVRSNLGAINGIGPKDISVIACRKLNPLLQLPTILCDFHVNPNPMSYLNILFHF